MYRVYCISFLTLAFMNISSGFRLVNKHWPPQYLKYASNGSLPRQESCAQCSTHICEILMIKPRSDAWTCTRIQWYYYWSKNIFQTVTAFFWKGQFLLFIVRRKSRFLILTLKKALWHWTQSKNKNSIWFLHLPICTHCVMVGFCFLPKLSEHSVTNLNLCQ